MNRLRKIPTSVSKLGKLSIILFAFVSISYNSFSQNVTDFTPSSAGNSDNLIVSRNSSYVVNIEVSKETMVNISIFDESDNLIDVLFYEYVKPGRLEFDLAKRLPNGNITCKIMIGQESEVLKLIVI